MARRGSEEKKMSFQFSGGTTEIMIQIFPAAPILIDCDRGSEVSCGQQRCSSYDRPVREPLSVSLYISSVEEVLGAYFLQESQDYRSTFASLTCRDSVNGQTCRGDNPCLLPLQSNLRHREKRKEKRRASRRRASAYGVQNSKLEPPIATHTLPGGGW